MLSHLPDGDHQWSEEDWKQLLEFLVDEDMLTYKDIGAAVLGMLNPPQVGTAVASKKSFQKHFPYRKTWVNVRKWFYKQPGRCEDCGTRLALQVEHVRTRKEYGDDADTLDNITLCCRRCNMARRPSHKQAGLTYLTAEAGLMWLLLVKKPKTYQKYEKMCRDYGFTMANIRFQEAWAMARWLNSEGKYTISKDSTL